MTIFASCSNEILLWYKNIARLLLFWLNRQVRIVIWAAPIVSTSIRKNCFPKQKPIR